MEQNSGEKRNCAIYYIPEAYESEQANIVGRQSAGAGFLEALTRHGGVEALLCLTTTEDFFQEFQRRIGRIGNAVPPCRWIKPGDLVGLSDAGCIFQPGPIIAESAWMRRYGDERAFSICGITHSVATERVVRGIRDFITAPIQPWDALICTSQAVRAATMRIVESWVDYLEARGFKVPPVPMRTAVIPLGVHLEQFERNAEREARGQALRQSLGLEEEDVAALYFGRLNFLSKAHPTPMFRACELAQRRLPAGRLHLLLAGQLSDPRTAAEFNAARRLFCPSVAVHWIDGADAEKAHDAWYAADFFLSLADNVQESFGLTPLEAMAASLPCIVSDWDGYRETVADGDTGFCIPTLMAPPCSGIALADDHARQAFDHFSYIGLIAQSTAVDIDRCAEAIERLANDRTLRRRMGEAGRRRAATHYDWRDVIAQYQALWRELAEIRATATALGPRDAGRQTVHPDYPDPFTLFSAHPSAALRDDSRLRLADLDARFVVADLRQGAMHLFARSTLLADDEIARVIAALEREPRAVTEILALLKASDRPKVLRTLLWLYKFGVVSLAS